jgi:phosphoribosyl-AMP cyclohydrolase / phosphoribosyl-ATP pyrophosphohydrolase
MRKLDIEQLDFTKSEGGLMPAIVQDADTSKVLMLGFMNESALRATIHLGTVTFYSRSKDRLWTKGESSGHYLQLVDISPDCDQDTLLIKARPLGPTCHTGSNTCWEEENVEDVLFLAHLEGIIKQRKDQPSDSSYTASLFAKGINKIAQKVGEEAVEIVIEAKDDNTDLFLGEAADLLFHYLVLLQAKGFKLSDVINVLKARHKK